jgi:hypothetical protein
MLISGRVALFLLAMIVALDGGPLRAQDLDAGKTGQRLFASNCSSCHRTPRGMAKRTNRISLFYFLREHYTTSQQSANELTAYLIAVGGEAPRAKRKPTSGSMKSTASKRSD